MSLRDQAAADALSFLEDDVGGFACDITVTTPLGVELELKGYASDIGQTLDPETGQAVTGRRASVALPIVRFTAAGVELPRHIADRASRPWVVQIADIEGVLHTYAVAEAMPDRAIGVVTCLLQAYRPSP